MQKNFVSATFFIAFFVGNLLRSINTDIFTSSADLQKLAGVEKDISELIDNYINIEMERLERLKRLVKISRFRFISKTIIKISIAII